LVARLLLENDADPEVRTGNGHTPLFIAIEQGSKYIVKSLLGGGANRDIEDWAGKTPQSLVVEKGDEIAALLLEV